MRRRHYFLLFYYSQFPLIALAMVLTGAIGAVFYHRFMWEAVFLVGLSTFFTYSIDNLIDWEKDKAHYSQIRNMISDYHKVLSALIPASALGIIILTLKSSNELRIGLLLLGASVAMGVSRFSNYRSKSINFIPPIWIFIINRIFITTVWTIVCVLLPTWYRNSTIKKITWHVFIYMYSLIFIYAVLWKFEKSDYTLKKSMYQSKIFLLLACLPVIATMLVIYDVYKCLLPKYNLFNLMPPIASLIGLLLITRHPILIRRKISALTFVLITMSSLTAMIYLLCG
ncbi:MAG: hypothetical protein ACTSQ8_24980 [Candidatus Helarchaeota archaeon]